MSDYRVELDTYNGPLDLLLFLVRRDEVDVHDIPIARILDQYLTEVFALLLHRGRNGTPGSRGGHGASRD